MKTCSAERGLVYNVARLALATGLAVALSVGLLTRYAWAQVQQN
jgi:hypothetical protein